MRKRPSVIPKLGVIAVLVAAAIVLSSPYTFLPHLLGGVFARSIERQMNLPKAPDIALKSDPPYKMLVGKFSRGRIVIRKASFGNVQPDWVKINLAPFDLNMIESLASGDLKSREPISGKARMELSQREVNRIVASRIKTLPIGSINLEKGGVLLRTRIELLNTSIPISVGGRLGVRDNALIFRPDRVSAFGFAVPENLSKRFLIGAEFSYRLRDLPLKAKITGIRVLKDHLILSGDIRLLSG